MCRSDPTTKWEGLEEEEEEDHRLNKIINDHYNDAYTNMFLLILLRYS